MKILNISNISSSNAMPIKSGTLQFLQDAHKEALAGLVTNVIPNPLANTIYILSGCKNSTTAPIHTLSAGVLFYNGEIFNFDGATFTLTGLQKAYARIETTQYLTNADPVQFTDGVSRNVHNVRKIVIENTTVSSGLPEFINFINVGQWKDATDALSLAVTTLQATDVSLQNQINVLNASLPKNKGYISGLNLPVTSGTLTVGGDITSATGTASDGVLVTMSNAMPNIDYYVRCIVESLGTASQDQQSAQGMFKKVSTTQFYYIQAETNNATQSLKVHFEAIAY
jgi:hypothetical protein